MLLSLPLLRFAAASLLSVAALTAAAAPVAFSFTGSINYMIRYTQADNSVSRVFSSDFPGALVEQGDTFSGQFFYDDTAPLGPMQQAQPDDGTFLRYMAPADSSGVSIASGRNDLAYVSESSSEFFVNDGAFTDSVSIFNYSQDSQFVRHGGVSFYGPVGVLQAGHARSLAGPRADSVNRP